MVDKCPKDKEFFEKQYVRLGKPTTQIAKEFNLSLSTVNRRLKKFKIIRSKSESKKMERNGMWRGDNVKYHALHDWVRNHKPKPRLCERCNKMKKLELANISRKYKRDINDYNWLCKNCHTKFDYETGVRK